MVKLEAALEQQKRSNELLHQSLLEMQQHKEQLDTLLADARSQIRAVADSIIIRNPYSDQALVFLIAHGRAAQSVVKMQIDLHGSQAGEVYLSRKTSIYSTAMVNKAHEKRLDTKSGFQSNNILTKPLLKFGSELVGVVQFLNEDRTTPFTLAPKALRAVFEMQREFSVIKQEWQCLNYALDLLDHRSIASGTVYGRRMGYSGASIFTIMGAPVNLAAHLCDQARTASERILVSEDTEQKLRHAMPSGWYLERFALPRYAAYQVRYNAAAQMAKEAALP